MHVSSHAVNEVISLKTVIIYSIHRHNKRMLTSRCNGFYIQHRRRDEPWIHIALPRTWLKEKLSLSRTSVSSLGIGLRAHTKMKSISWAYFSSGTLEITPREPQISEMQTGNCRPAPRTAEYCWQTRCMLLVWTVHSITDISYEHRMTATEMEMGHCSNM